MIKASAKTNAPANQSIYVYNYKRKSYMGDMAYEYMNKYETKMEHAIK